MRTSTETAASQGQCLHLERIDMEELIAVVIVSFGAIVIASTVGCFHDGTSPPVMLVFINDNK